MSTHNICFLWRTDKNYPSVIIKYTPYLSFLILTITAGDDRMFSSFNDTLYDKLSYFNSQAFSIDFNPCLPSGLLLMDESIYNFRAV